MCLKSCECCRETARRLDELPVAPHPDDRCFIDLTNTWNIAAKIFHRLAIQDVENFNACGCGVQT